MVSLEGEALTKDGIAEACFRSLSAAA